MRGNLNLGDTVRDTISGFSGVVVARTEWFNGCVRITIQPKAMHDGKPIDSQTLDLEQLELVERATPRAEAARGGDRPAITRAADPR